MVVRRRWCAVLLPPLLVLLHSLPRPAAAGAAYLPDYAVYHSLDRYYAEVRALADDESAARFLRVEEVGRSGEGRPIVAVRLGRAADAGRARVLMTFGEHARELVVVESFFDLVRNVTRGMSMPCWSREGALSRHVVDGAEVVLVGMLNPDGRARLERTGDWCWRNNGRGVDLNRNFDWRFGGAGSSGDPGDPEEYRGPRPFSEPESRALRDLAERFRPHAFFSVHSGERQVFVPFVDSVSRGGGGAAAPARGHAAAELRAVDRMCAASGGHFDRARSGVAWRLNEYPADGTLFDWAAGALGVPLSFCLEVYGGPEHPHCFVQFNPPAERLAAALAPVRAALLEGVLAAAEFAGRRAFSPPPPRAAAPSAAAAAVWRALEGACAVEDALRQVL